MGIQGRVAITGITGFIGRQLPGLLAERGLAVTGVSRSGKGDVPGVDRWQTPDQLDFSGHSAVINLAGEPINQRWTEESRKRFRESRVDFTRKVVAAIVMASIAPLLLFVGAFLLFRFGGNFLGPVGAAIVDKALAEKR